MERAAEPGPVQEYLHQGTPLHGHRRGGPSEERADQALLITGGHDHERSFYSLFDGYKELPRLPVADSATAFQNDLRGKYDVLILYDFSRDLNEKARKNLRDYVESGKGGIVVLHHALLDYPDWAWWAEDVVGGRYRLKRDGQFPSSTVKNDQPMTITPAEGHPITAGLSTFQVVDETYKGMFISPRVRPLLTTDNAHSDRIVAWVSPCSTSRVAAIQLGHGTSIFAHPSYRCSCTTRFCGPRDGPIDGRIRGRVRSRAGWPRRVGEAREDTP